MFSYLIFDNSDANQYFPPYLGTSHVPSLFAVLPIIIIVLLQA